MSDHEQVGPTFDEKAQLGLNRQMGAVGQSLLRSEDRVLLTGASAFADDLDLPETLHVAFVRSPIAHARIDRVDLSQARLLEGVEAFGADDLSLPPLWPPITTLGCFSPPRPILASDVVRFVGEPVAAVVAPSRYTAEDAAELVELELFPLDPLPDPAAALREDAPRLHNHESNVFLDWRIDVGDVDDAFKRAAVVVERHFRSPRYAAVPIEPRGLVASVEPEGLVLYASTQVPHMLAKVVAEILELAESKVRVVCADIGGGFGQKCHVYPEEVVVAWLARRLRTPIKWIEDRWENFVASSQARDQTLVVRAAADSDGRLLALDADIVCDQGAYGSYAHGPILEALGTSAMLPGPYRLRNYRARSRSVATTKCPEGAYRGVGLPVSAFAHERLMDVLAAELQLDRAEVRRRNLLGADELPYTTVTNQRYDSGDYVRALEAALNAIGWDDFPAQKREAMRHGRLLGLGIACYVEFTGLNSQVFSARGMVGIAGHDGAHVMLDTAGHATVWTTLPSMGQGLETTFAQLISDELGLPFEAITIARADTRVGHLAGTGTFGSRSAIAGGGALLGAASELRRRLLEDASELLEIAPSDLEVAGGAVRAVGTASVGVPIGEVVARAGSERYTLSTHFDPPSVQYPYATHACKVEVDRDTGGITILRYVVVEDCGRLINPRVAEGQTHGATIQGIGGAIYESVEYDENAQPRNPSLMDYLVPTACEAPELSVLHLEIPAPDSPTGAKGIGEGGTLGPPGALANAVSDALKAEMNELPLSPDRVCAALERHHTASYTRTRENHSPNDRW